MKKKLISVSHGILLCNGNATTKMYSNTTNEVWLQIKYNTLLPGNEALIDRVTDAVRLTDVDLQSTAVLI